MMIHRGILIRSLFIAVFVLCPSLYAARRTTDFTQKPDSWFRSDEGRKALNNILSWQSEHGDWPKNKDCSSSEFSGNRDKLREPSTIAPLLSRCATLPALSEQQATNAMRKRFSPASITSLRLSIRTADGHSITRCAKVTTRISPSTTIVWSVSWRFFVILRSPRTMHSSIRIAARQRRSHLTAVSIVS